LSRGGGKRSRLRLGQAERSQRLNKEGSEGEKACNDSTRKSPRTLLFREVEKPGKGSSSAQTQRSKGQRNMTLYEKICGGTQPGAELEGGVGMWRRKER